MSKPEWGTKRLCPGCSALYYDMKKAPPVCPKCGVSYDPEALLKSRRKMVPEEPKKKVAAPIVEEEVEDIEVEAEVGDDADVVAEEIDDDEEIEVEVEDDDKEV